MNLFFGFVVSLFATLVLIPPLAKLAGGLGFMDRPAPRKVHDRLIPRCGGIAVVLGAAIPVLLWIPFDGKTWSVVTAASVVALFGMWDDRSDLNYKWKLFGQVIAVLIALQGGLVLDRLPFFGLDPVAPWISYPVTLVFLLGATNAINLSDGLDGLAAGCVLLTLGAITALAYMADGASLALMALAVMGGILGFLRYNTYPAVVFLGDSGSQFLGFAAGALTILLCNEVNPALNPALPLLLLGLPIFDTLYVMTQRTVQGRSPFAPDRNHIHHRLLALGFKHYEVVSIIYLIQALLVCAAVLLSYNSDVLIICVFAAAGGLVAGFFCWARFAAFRVRRAVDSEHPEERRNLLLRRAHWLPAFTMRYMAASIIAFLLLGALAVGRVPLDFAILAIGLLVPIGILVIFVPRSWRQSARLSTYVAALLIAYLLLSQTPAGWWQPRAADIGVAGLAVALVLAIRITRREQFQITPQDLLIVLFGILVPILAPEVLADLPIGRVAFHLVVLFYATEFLLSAGITAHNDRQAGQMILFFSTVALTVVAARGFFGY